MLTRAWSPARRPRPNPGTDTLGQFCEDRLAAVCEHTSFSFRKDEILGVYRDLSASWSARRLDARPPWSGLTCDLTPFEVSVAASPTGAEELRFLIEPQAEPPSPASYWAQTRALFDVLEHKWGADLIRLRRIEDLVEPEIGMQPTEEEGASCAGYGAVFSGQRRGFKFWFNPDCKGVKQTGALCREVMQRLGLAHVWRWTSERLPSTTALLLGLELGRGSDARVKVYLRVKNPDVATLARVAALATNYVPGDLETFWASLRWNSFPVMRPHLIELNLVEGSPRPIGYALQFATYPLLPNDDLVRRCVRASLRHYGIDRRLYDATLDALAGQRDLEGETLIHSWVTFKRDHRPDPCIAVYFPGRAYLARFGALGVNPRVQWPYAQA
jgi:hypothetical protein